MSDLGEVGVEDDDDRDVPGFDREDEVEQDKGAGKEPEDKVEEKKTKIEEFYLRL